MAKSLHEGPKRRRGRAVCIGLGNTILSDDGIGIYVLRAIKKKARSTAIDFIEASAGGLDLLDYMTGYDFAVIIDAVRTGRHKPGTVLKIPAQDLPGGSSLTRHQVSLAEALALAGTIGMPVPENILIYGIEVEDIETFSETCSPALVKRLPHIVREIVPDIIPQFEKIAKNQEKG